MYESTGHFLLRDSAPHLVLTVIPTALRAHFDAKKEALANAMIAVTVPVGEALSVTDGVQAGAIAPDSGKTEISEIWGQWLLETAAGPVQVEGHLIPLSGLGLHGRRSAEYHARASSERVLEEGAHMIRVGAAGEVLGWAITPRALKH